VLRDAHAKGGHGGGIVPLVDSGCQMHATPNGLAASAVATLSARLLCRRLVWAPTEVTTDHLLRLGSLWFRCLDGWRHWFQFEIVE